MTATEVGGVAVVASEPAVTSLPRREGEPPVYFKQIVKLRLEDGSELYGCVHCDFTAPGVGQVRPHLRKHKRPNPEGRTVVLAVELEEMSVAELLVQKRRADGLLTQVSRLSQQLSDAKKRALVAERDIAELRRLINGVPR